MFRNFSGMTATQPGTAFHLTVLHLFTEWKLNELDGLTLQWCKILPLLAQAFTSRGGSRPLRGPQEACDTDGSQAGETNGDKVPSGEVAIRSCDMSIPNKCCRGHASWSGDFARVWGRSLSGLSLYTQWWHVVVIMTPLAFWQTNARLIH